MASPQQLEANRRNAQKSTGPKTEEGKGRSRLNAVRHGLRAETIDVLPHEDSADFHRRVDTWLCEFAPKNAAEAHLIRRAALLSWKLDRADQHELSTLSRRVIEAVEALEDDDRDEVVLETARIASFDTTPDGERIRRYQFALSRDLIRALRALPQTNGKTSTIAPITSRSVLPQPKVVETGRPNEANRDDLPESKPVCGRDALTASRTPAPNEADLVTLDERVLNADRGLTLSAGQDDSARRESPDLVETADRRFPTLSETDRTNEPKFATVTDAKAVCGRDSRTTNPTPAPNGPNSDSTTPSPKAPNEPKFRSSRKWHRRPISRHGAKFREPESRSKSTFDVALVKGRPCLLSETSLLSPNRDRG